MRDQPENWKRIFDLYVGFLYGLAIQDTASIVDVQFVADGILNSEYGQPWKGETKDKTTCNYGEVTDTVGDGFDDFKNSNGPCFTTLLWEKNRHYFRVGENADEKTMKQCIQPSEDATAILN